MDRNSEAELRERLVRAYKALDIPWRIGTRFDFVDWACWYLEVGDVADRLDCHLTRKQLVLDDYRQAAAVLKVDCLHLIDVIDLRYPDARGLSV